MSYETKAPQIRVHKSMQDYLDKLTKETGLSRVQCSRLLATSLENRQLHILKKKKRKKWGFKFDLEI